MSYTKNPHLPKVRAKAVFLVKVDGWSMRAVARHLGVEPSTILRWCRRGPRDGRVSVIETRSSRPRTSPRSIDPAIVKRIIDLRRPRGRCAVVIHGQLLREGHVVSLSTVKRTLQRRGFIKARSPWKKWHQSGERPAAAGPGSLVEMDSVHLWLPSHERHYVLTLIDVFSRWAYARAFARLSTHAALLTARQAMVKAPFSFSCIQSDHGPEFTQHFTSRLQAHGVLHRHSRVRRPNDNAHIERFNRTIQDDLRREIHLYKTNIPKLNRVIMDYLRYYNTERLHLGLNLQTPQEVLRRS